MSRSPPFHAEHIGSLLRPRALLAAMESHAKGTLSAQALAMAEDQAIDEAIALQERAGLKLVTDGEFRRSSYHSFFLASSATSASIPPRQPTPAAGERNRSRRAAMIGPR